MLHSLVTRMKPAPAVRVPNLRRPPAPHPAGETETREPDPERERRRPPSGAAARPPPPAGRVEQVFFSVNYVKNVLVCMLKATAKWHAVPKRASPESRASQRARLGGHFQEAVPDTHTPVLCQWSGAQWSTWTQEHGAACTSRNVAYRPGGK